VKLLSEGREATASKSFHSGSPPSRLGVRVDVRSPSENNGPLFEILELERVVVPSLEELDPAEIFHCPEDLQIMKSVADPFHIK
jgi:hypothetical protein